MKTTAALIVLAMALIAVVMMTTNGPSTYGEVASNAQAACQRKYPDAPASYCQLAGQLDAVEKLCKDQPWRCDRRP